MIPPLPRPATLAITLMVLVGAGAAVPAQEPEPAVVQEEQDPLAEPVLPDFLDVPDPAMQETYGLSADRNFPRGMRLYGESLLQEGNDEGFAYVARAAGKGDARAAYLVAEALAYGRWGQEQDYTLAMKWLHSSMSGDYAPAYELMAALSWDGDWDCLPNTHDAIWYLDKAISGYAKAEIPDDELKKSLKGYIKSLKRLRAIMSKTKDYSWEQIGQRIPHLQGLAPTFIQLRLSTFPDDTDAGLRQRLTYIQATMEQRRGKYKLGKLAPVYLAYIPIRATDAEDKGNIALTTWSATDTGFTAEMDVHTHNLPERSGLTDSELAGLGKDSYRLVVVNDALAHELAHIYFCSRYPKLAEFSTGDAHMTYEGHATNAAYEFTNATFFHGRLSPERYADLFLADEYKEYFFWFRENCLSPASLVFWEILDRWERNSGETGYLPHNRQQEIPEAPAAIPLRFFGKGFQGYM